MCYSYSSADVELFQQWQERMEDMYCRFQAKQGEQLRQLQFSTWCKANAMYYDLVYLVYLVYFLKNLKQLLYQ